MTNIEIAILLVTYYGIGLAGTLSFLPTTLEKIKLIGIVPSKLKTVTIVVTLSFVTPITMLADLGAYVYYNYKKWRINL